MPSVPVIGLIVLGVGLVILLASGSGGSVLGLDSDQFASLIYATALLVVFGSAFLWRRQLSGVVRGLGLWFLIILAMVAGYQYRYELQDVASRVTAGLVPGSPLTVTDSAGRKSVVLEKRPNGHFEAKVLVDGTPLRLLVDTGASSTVLSRADAEAAGIDIGALQYTVPVSTANGVARAAAARAANVSLGEISRDNVPILVAADGALEQSLLGMSFISTLSGVDLRGDRMVLRD